MVKTTCSHEGCNNEALNAYTPDDNPATELYHCDDHWSDAWHTREGWDEYRAEVGV